MTATLPLLSFATTLAAWLGWLRLAAEAVVADDPDAADMAKVAEGDGAALQRIFDRWKLPLLTYFYRALGSHADAEDLVLQTFTRVWRASPRYRPDAPFAGWLFAVARRELLHEVRRRRRKPAQPVPPEELDHGDADPEERRRLAETEERLLLALQALPERQRTALLLVSRGELDTPAIALALGLKENALHALVFRARRALRSALEAIR